MNQSITIKTYFLNAILLLFSSSIIAQKNQTIDYDLSTGIGHIQQLVSSIESGDIIIDTTTVKDALTYYNVVDTFANESSDRFNSTSYFSRYKISKTLAFYKNQLNSIKYNFKVSDGNEYKVIIETEKAYEYLVKVFGKPESTQYPKWETNKYTISFSKFNNGYVINFESITINKYKQDRFNAIVAGSAFQEITELLDALLYGTIIPNKTTVTDFLVFDKINAKPNLSSNKYKEILELSKVSTIGFEAYSRIKEKSYYASDKIQYKDHYLSRNISSKDNLITIINYYVSVDDPDYSIEHTIEEDITALIIAKLGSDYVTDGKVKTWSKDGYTVTLEDEYSIDLKIK
jgi:hypothetical protein